MSEKIKEFLEKVNADKENSAAYANADDLKEISQLAKSMGYDLSPAELQEYFQKNQSLSDSDLDNISGGTSMMGQKKQSHGGWYSGD